MSKKDLLIPLLKEAIYKCYKYDHSLIERSMEQASVARIYYYIQESLNNDNRFYTLNSYNLDSEYNKNGQHIKSTPRCPKGTRPDILLHKRWTSDDMRLRQENLLVVEFKSLKAKIRMHKDINRNLDFIKLEDFTSDEVYNYYLGIYVKLSTNGAEYIYFQNGHQTSERELQ